MSKIISRKRTLSRLMAIQILYQHKFFNGDKSFAQIKEDVIENYALQEDEELSSYLDKIDEEFLDNLIAGVGLGGNIDDEIQLLLKDGFTLEKLDDVLQPILRLASFELKFMQDVPYKVIIDEYVDIAASFFENKKITFINGILENLAKKFRDTATK